MAPIGLDSISEICEKWNSFHTHYYSLQSLQITGKVI